MVCKSFMEKNFKLKKLNKIPKEAERDIIFMHRKNQCARKFSQNNKIK